MSPFSRKAKSFGEFTIRAISRELYQQIRCSFLFIVKLTEKLIFSGGHNRQFDKSGGEMEYFNGQFDCIFKLKRWGQPDNDGSIPVVGQKPGLFTSGMSFGCFRLKIKKIRKKHTKLGGHNFAAISGNCLPIFILSNMTKFLANIGL
ncbi:hypothetical protein MRBLMN1_004843 [Chitinophaga ginsengisegetis]|uniref:hypothetical protein n=1 Tax=Chitinophaga ginsengisegetis TaxID=393003 RepID=UPI003437F480